MADREPVIPENPIQRANRQNRAACYAYGRFDADPIRYVPSAQFIALVTERGVDTEGFRNLYNELLAAKTAAAEDQSKPREWRDREGDLWRDVNADQVVLIECKGRLPETAVGPHSRAVVERSWGPLSEVLADSEERAS